MRISLQRTGGFAGINQINSLSTDQMPAQDAQNVANLVQASGFFDLPTVIRSTEPGEDRFQYKISIESEQGTHTVQVDEGAVPASLKPVLSWMKNFARAQKSG